MEWRLARRRASWGKTPEAFFSPARPSPPASRGAATGAFPPIPRSARDERRRRRRRLPDSRALGTTRIPARSSRAIAGLPQHGRRALDGPLARRGGSIRGAAPVPRRESGARRRRHAFRGPRVPWFGHEEGGRARAESSAMRSHIPRRNTHIPTCRAGTHAANARRRGNGTRKRGTEGREKDDKRTEGTREPAHPPPPPSNEPTKQTNKRTSRQTPNENKALGRTRDGGGGGGAGGLREPAPRSPTRKPSPRPEPRVRGRGRREGASENNLAERGRRKALNND